MSKISKMKKMNKISKVFMNKIGIAIFNFRVNKVLI